MGRSSTFGMLYLVKRPEGGFSYIRDLPARVAATLSGELALSWTAERRKVGGRSVLKIALGTSSGAWARHRWLEMPQIEHLIGFAKDSIQRCSSRPSRVTRLQLLPADAIRAVADRVYQEILAADDAEAFTSA